MDQLVGGVISQIYGAEEFIYLLGQCLFNYGSIIGHGMYEHTKYPSSAAGLPITSDSLQTQPAQSESERPKAVQKSNPIQHHEEAPSAKMNTEQTTTRPQDYPAAEESQCHGKANPSSSSKPKSKQAASDKEKLDEQEIQIRETIRGLRVDITDEMGILDFSDIAGLENVKLALEEFACFFLHFPHLTRNLRQRSTTGILLFGPQGTGKTLLVKSFANRYNLALYDVRASAIMSKFVGESEKFVRALFKEVRINAPAILMLDECDGLLCNPAADITQSHNYRLLQNELKNQWSDLIYSRDEVIVIGATNKPHDIDMDGFGRRLSLKLHIDLPNEKGCAIILQGALNRLRHQLEDEDFSALGFLCYEKRLSGYDIDCLVEGQLRRAIRNITVAEYFHEISWEGNAILVPCNENDTDAARGPWNKVVTTTELSYRPFTFGEIEAAVQKARPTVDNAMRQKHSQFASQYGTED